VLREKPNTLSRLTFQVCRVAIIRQPPGAGSGRAVSVGMAGGSDGNVWPASPNALGHSWPDFDWWGGLALAAGGFGVSLASRHRPSSLLPRSR